MKEIIDTQNLAEILRKKAVDIENEACLMSDLRETQEEKDLSLPVNCRGFGRIHHFRLTSGSQWISDPLPMLPASKYLGIPETKVIPVQVFQLAACNFHCWYCFVDSILRSADSKHSSFVTARELFDYMSEGKVKARVIDLSGGHPGLVPEYALWFLRTRAEMGLEKTHFIWTDDNLSTDYLWRYLSKDDIEYMINAPGFSQVGCLKGFDSESFSFNTGADKHLFDYQIELLGRLVKAGFDQYGYITLTTLNLENLESKITELFDKIQKQIHLNFPLRIVPLQIFKFNANKNRYIQQADENQYRVLSVWQAEMQQRFSKSELSKPMTEVSLEE